MRIKIPLLFVLLLFFVACYAQDKSDAMLVTDHHKYLTYEAWELVKQVHPEAVYSVMNNKVGTDWQNAAINGGVEDYNNWKIGKIITGAYREDIQDIVYGYTGPHAPGHPEDGPYVTITHFWDADASGGGIAYNSEMHAYPYASWNYYENSYVKLNAFWNTRKASGAPYIVLGAFLIGDSWFWIRITALNDDGTPTTLDEAYKDKRKWKVTTFTNPFTNQWEPEDQPYPNLYDFLQKNTNDPPSQAWCNEKLDNVCWEIVGRMCHLIEDAGVPPHAHNDEHIYDSYEKNYMVQQAHFLNWNHTNAITQAQSLNPPQPPIMDLMSKNNPLLYALYTTNQIADRFASDGSLSSTQPGDIIPGDIAYEHNVPDNYATVIQPIYDRLENENVPFNPGSIVDSYSQKVAEYSYVFSMRSTASFLWYVYQKFNIQSSIPPVIYNVVSSTPDNCVYRGETIRLYCHSNNAPNITYNWEYVPCEDDQCNANIQGITITPQGNTLLISNSNYQSLTCSNCDQSDFVPSALYYKIKVTATTPNCPSVTYEYLLPQQGIVPVAMSRPYAGCPYVYVQNDSGQFISDNNILHKSEFDENVGLEISDKYLLNVKPGVFDNKISMNLFESTHDISTINSIKLLAVDHPVGTKIGVTENNDIIMYFDEDVESPKNADRNHIENITQYVQYNNPRDNDTVSGIPTDDIYNNFDEEIIGGRIQSSRNKFNRLGRNLNVGTGDSVALIMRVGLNENVDRPPTWTPVAKRPAGNVTLTSDAASISTQFARRESPSLIIIPFGTNTSIEKADISWERDFSMSFAAVADVFYGGFDVTELPLSVALNSANYDLLEDLLSVDGYYATLDTSGIIMLQFDNVENTSGMIRDYVLVTDGQYAAGTPGQRPASMPKGLTKNASDNVLGFTNKLNANFPNPFNPTTKINYEIKKEGFVSLKIYNVVGQLVKELVGEFKNAGNYIVEFNGSHLASGTYYYRIEANDFVETKKMILIK